MIIYVAYKTWVIISVSKVLSILSKSKNVREQRYWIFITRKCIFILAQYFNDLILILFLIPYPKNIMKIPINSFPNIKQHQ